VRKSRSSQVASHGKTKSLPTQIILLIESLKAKLQMAASADTIEAARDKLRRPTSTSDAVKPSCWKEKGSNAKPSDTDACITKLTQPKIKPDAPESPLD
jgi:hypothetical protein